jgi:hypothetical protein
MKRYFLVLLTLIVSGCGFMIYPSPVSIPFRVGSVASSFNAFIGTTLATWPAVPNMGNLTKNNNLFTDSSLPPTSGSGSPVSRCTDAVISPSDTNKSFSVGLGGSGDSVYMFNANSTAMHININGNGRLTLFNPSTMVCGDPVTGKVITGDKNIGTPGSSSVSTSFQSGSWDFTDPTIYYLFPGDTGTQTQKISINPATGQFCKNGTYTSCSPGSANVWDDYIYGFPHNSANATNAPTWALGQVYPLGQYVTYTMQASDSLRPFVWNATTTYSRGDVIVPTVNNSSGCAFKEMNATGTTSSSQPNWNTASNSCQVSHGAIGDGTASWWPIGPPNFIYQLVATSGAVTTATPFVPPGTGHPDIYLTVTDSNGNQWMNVGPDEPATWADAAFLSADSTRSCTGFSTNSYGRTGNNYSDHAGQGTGVLVVCYDTVNNVYISLNTLTGVQSKVTCSLGIPGGYNCNGGTWTMTPQGIATNVSLSGGNCGFVIHNIKGSFTMDYPAVALQTGLSGVCAFNGSVWSWQPFATYNAATNMQKYRANLNHWAQGNTHLMEVGQGCLDNSIGGSGCPVGVYGFSTGVYTNYFSSTDPYVIPPITWQVNPCASPWTFGAPAPCGFGVAYDSHMAWAYNPGGTDTTPVCGSMYNLSTLAPPPLAPWQGELICISTSPTWTDPTAPNPAAKVWRFTHEFNTGGNSFFDAQFAISQCSTDGKFCAFTSDWNCTLGTTSGASSGNCGAPWVPNSAYVLNTMINPFSSTGGSGTNFGVWQVTNVGSGTSGSSAPTWTTGGGNNCTAGTVVTDANSMQYTCLGASNGRSDVFVVNLK